MATTSTTTPSWPSTAAPLPAAAGAADDAASPSPSSLSTTATVTLSLRRGAVPTLRSMQRAIDVDAMLRRRSDVPACALQHYADAEAKKPASSSSSTTSSFHPAVSATFMVHYSPLRKRRAEMQRMLAQHGVAVTRWITEFDRENITGTGAAIAECFHPKSWMDAAAFSGGSSGSAAAAARKAKRHTLGRPIPEQQRLRPTQISVVTKHYFALYLAAKQPGLSLVLEDDVLLRNGFAAHVGKILDEAAKMPPSVTAEKDDDGDDDRRWNFDVLMVGGCLKMFAYRKRYAAPRRSEHLYQKQEARCAHAYIVSPRGARRILRSLPLTLPIDFQLSSAFKEEDLAVLWVEPWLAVQGDIDGGCVTSEFYKKCPTMFLKPFPREFNLSFVKTPASF